jgi:lipopolysaccharide transport system permease protein
VENDRVTEIAKGDGYTQRVNLVVSARRHAPLFRNLVKREMRQRYKASAFGLLWTLINPIVMVAAYWFVFRFVFPAGANDPYALFLFVGLTVWSVFMGGAQAAASSLVANANLVTKVSFPRQILPLSAMTGNWFTAATMLTVAVPLCLIFAHGNRVSWLAIPPIVFLLIVMTMGFGLLVAAINVYLRDAEHILAALSLPWFFLTPIFYSFDMIDGPGRDGAIDVLHYANPVSPFVLAIRDPLFFGRWPASGDVIYCVAAAAVIGAIGLTVFRRLEREMAVEL